MVSPFIPSEKFNKLKKKKKQNIVKKILPWFSDTTISKSLNSKFFTIKLCSNGRRMNKTEKIKIVFFNGLMPFLSSKYPIKKNKEKIKDNKIISLRSKLAVRIRKPIIIKL